MIFDQARRGVSVKMVDHFFVTDIYLAFFNQSRYRNHDGEFFRVAFKIVDHSDHGLVVLAHEHDLRCFIENLRIGFGDVETAKAMRRLGHNQ